MYKNIGKNVGGNLYFHVESFPYLDRLLISKIIQATKISNIKTGKDFNVVKFTSVSKLSLLLYDNFFENPFPELFKSYIVDLDKKTFSTKDYSEINNPFILHRKELLLPEIHHRYPEYAALTESLESANLFQHTSKIGRSDFWYKLIEQNGFTISTLSHCYV